MSVLALACQSTLAAAAPLAEIGLSADKIVWLGALGGACAFAVTAAVAFLRTRRAGDVRMEALARESRDLRLYVDRLESMLNTEEQRMIAWVGAEDRPRVWGVMPESSGAPRAPGQLLAFGSWLEPKSAEVLEAHLGRLRSAGDAFAVTLTTRKRTYVEAVGRTAGGVAVLRLRDLTGERQAQAELAARNARLSGELHMLHALLEAMPAPAWQRDAEGRVTWANSAYACAVDVADAATAVRDNVDFLDAAGREAMSRDRDDDGCFRARMPIVAAGERRVFEVTDVSANVGGAALAIDISELDRLKKELRRTEEFHGSTLDQLATAVAIYGGDRKLQFYNSAFRALWNLDTAFLDGRPEDGAVLDALRAARKLPEQADYRVWRTKMLESYQSLEARESWWHLPDGRTLRVIANPHPQGGVTYIYENVTERLDLESRYNALIRVQGETLDNLSEAVAVFGSDGRLRLWNPAFGSIWDLPEDQLANMPHINDVVEWCAARPDEVQAWSQLAGSVTGLVDSRTHLAGRMERRDGTVLDYATVPLPDGGTLVTFVNVTDSVNVERALVEKNEALEQADQLKNAFIQHVSYELRSPLTNIIGFAQLLSDPKFGELSRKQGEYADYILSSSSALLAIINDILDLATIDAGIMELDLGEVDVADTVAAAVEGLKDRLADAKIVLRTHVPGDIGTLYADERRLRQVLFNLIANAVRYSDEGGVIDVTCGRKDGAVVFTVKDHGCGIPQEMIDQVFSRFVGHDAGTKRRGAGLGLSIVKSFVELHGGQVEIQSREGVGTTVTCTFPAVPESSGRVAAE
ncbi:Alkaline phosphatase synthesis sensor protein phor [Polymorphum gilvum SL003B-26A1]|uniref:histidine kinase n=1 Tax=Polymorphum gilvum (strain LMG 25793 / CGMCC 1.9160 / SL003B-26A1) TaxID=991905 RepID=F2IV99_POLGS|nr:Alkaline phosphatase synthesis sensor protein phor [Polymorphum gilvum SL003B-26A1]